MVMSLRTWKQDGRQFVPSSIVGSGIYNVGFSGSFV